MQKFHGIDDEKVLLNEGLGTAYEYFVKRVYLSNLTHRFPLRHILEVHYSHGHADCLVLASAKSEVVFVNNSKQYSKEPKFACNEAYSLKNIQFIKGSPQTLPFNSNSFDLVFNADDIVGHPFEHIREMARVSKRLILVFVPNRLHIGDVLFRLYLSTAGSHSRAKHQFSMTMGTLGHFLQENRLTIVEQGGIDMPLWPSHLSLGGPMGRKKAWDRTKLDVMKFIRVQSALEDSLPRGIKAAQAHIVYALGAKT